MAWHVGRGLRLVPTWESTLIYGALLNAGAGMLCAWVFLDIARREALPP